MVILRKLKSATLVEALVATVLIVVIFMVASTMNNLVLNTYSKKEFIVNYRLNVLEYELQNHKRQVPYSEEYQDWKIVINSKVLNGIDTYEIMAVNAKGNELKRVRAYE
jgi:hypothetical protein